MISDVLGQAPSLEFLDEILARGGPNSWHPRGVAGAPRGAAGASKHPRTSLQFFQLGLLRLLGSEHPRFQAPPALSDEVIHFPWEGLGKSVRAKMA